MQNTSITEEILQRALAYARKINAQRITCLYLVVGDLASLSDKSVQEQWGEISKGTPAEGAALSFRHRRPELACLDCKKHYSPGGKELACPECGSVQVVLVSGREIYLEAIEVDLEG